MIAEAFNLANRYEITSIDTTQYQIGGTTLFPRAAFQTRFGVEPPDVSAGARFAAMRFAVRERAALHSVLEGGRIAFAEHMGATVIAPEAAMGATLVFEAA